MDIKQKAMLILACLPPKSFWNEGSVLPWEFLQDLSQHLSEKLVRKALFQGLKIYCHGRSPR